MFSSSYSEYERDCHQKPVTIALQRHLVLVGIRKNICKFKGVCIWRKKQLYWDSFFPFFFFFFFFPVFMIINVESYCFSLAVPTRRSAAGEHLGISCSTFYFSEGWHLYEASWNVFGQTNSVQVGCLVWSSSICLQLKEKYAILN